MKSSKITKMTDLKGKTIGVISETGKIIAEIMIAGSKGISLKDITFQPVGPNMAGYLATGKVDAVYTWDTLFEQYKRQGMDVAWVSGPEFDDYQSNVLATSEQLIKEKPKMIEGFLRAIAKGTTFSIEAPKATLALISKEAPHLAKDLDKAMIELQLANAGFQSKLTAQGGLGTNSVKSWELQSKALKGIGEISKVLPPDQYFTDQFIAAANRFDGKALRQEARKLEK